jgi:hypothetical protein
MTESTERLDERLKDFATERQSQIIDAVNAHGSLRAASRALGVNYRSVYNSVDAVTRKAALRGYAPDYDMTKVAAPGFAIKGTSTLYKDGKQAIQWVKTDRDAQQAEAIMRVAVLAMAEDIVRAEPVPFGRHVHLDLCNVYTLTDSHVGMLAWHREGGADWDLKIAEETLVGCFRLMIDRSPAAGVGFFNQLGDFLHSDGLLPVTPTSGHVLDQDGRFAKVVQVAIRIIRRVVDMMLRRHQKVVVLMAEGNHDMASSVWLRVMFKTLYEHEPRVEVIDSELPYYAYQHGRTMLAFHHGHLKKNDQLPLLFAAQFPRVWGDTDRRYCHVGHRHHLEEKEHSGMTVLQHQTLAARDAYAARGGWIADRRVTAVTYHLTDGDVGRTTVTPEMLTASA